MPPFVHAIFSISMFRVGDGRTGVIKQPMCSRKMLVIGQAERPPANPLFDFCLPAGAVSGHFPAAIQPLITQTGYDPGISQNNSAGFSQIRAIPGVCDPSREDSLRRRTNA